MKIKSVARVNNLVIPKEGCEVDAEWLVNYRVHNHYGSYQGELETLREQVQTLTNIVGRLLGKLPESTWLDVVHDINIEEAK